MSFNPERLLKVPKWLKEGEFYGQHDGPVTIRIWRNHKFLSFRVSDRNADKFIQVALASHEESYFGYRLTRALQEIEDATV